MPETPTGRRRSALNNQATLDALDAIHATTDPAERRNLEHQFHTDRQALYRQFAIQFARQGLTRLTDRDDAMQEIAKASHQLVRSWPDQDHDSYFEARLWLAARDRLRELRWQDDATGASTHVRTREGLLRHKAELEQREQREVSDREVVESYNEQMRRRLKDPVKNGRLATTDHMHPIGASVPLDDQTLAALDATVNPGDGMLLTRHETHHFLQHVARLARALSPELGNVADCYFRHAVDGGEPPTARFIAERLDLSYDRTTRAIHQLKDLGVAVILADFGVQHHAWAATDLDPAEYRAWAAHAFGPAEADAWLAIGVDTPAAAAAWRHAVGQPDVAARWVVARFGPAEAADWMAHDFRARHARGWADAGFGPAEARARRNCGQTLDVARSDRR